MADKTEPKTAATAETLKPAETNPENSQPVADEIQNANVVRVVKDGNQWCAVIGPDPQSGLMACGPTPERALLTLALKVRDEGWVFDPSYMPKTDPSYHDA